MIETTSKALKVSVTIDAAPLSGLTVPDGEPRSKIRILIAGRAYTAEVSATGLRKAVAIIDSEGPEAVAVVIQGKLVGSAIAEAGIVANVKTTAAVAE